MMYRRNAAQQPRVNWRAALAGISFINVAQRAVYALLDAAGVYAEAERAHRRWTRNRKRWNWHRRATASGLNGRRAMERRARQIAAGQLTVSNGLVPTAAQ